MVEFKKENGQEHYNRLKKEFNNSIDPRLRAVFLELGNWMFKQWRKPLIITSLNRTKEENIKVSGSKWSAHLFGRAGDYRCHGYSDSEIDLILDHLTLSWNKPNKKPFLYVIAHDSGSGKHIHTNITWAYSIKNYAV